MFQLNRLNLASVFLFAILPLVWFSDLILAGSSDVSEDYKSNLKEAVVIVPMRHSAMDEIVSGIIQELQSTDIRVTVAHAHGDITLMLALIRKHGKQNAIFMPIGTSTCQMTASHIKNRAIICVAADMSRDHHKLLTGVNDETDAVVALNILPRIESLGLIYSASEKVIPEVEALKKACKQNHTELHAMMIQNLSDMPSVLKNMPKEVSSILILKDHLVVSGLDSLVSEAEKRGIALLASDEGSVRNGAALAIGVKEKDIGIEAGKMVKSVLEGVPISKIAYKKMESRVLFINKQAFAKQKTFSRDQILKLKQELVEF
jgi:putative ABC transport system substrate-binding protein